MDHVDLPGPHEVGVALELVHAHPPSTDGFVPVGPKLGSAFVEHHLQVEAEQQHGVGLRRHLAQVAPLGRAAALAHFLPKLRDARLDARVSRLHVPGHERLASDTGRDTALLHDDVPRPLLGVVPEHDPHRHGRGGDPATGLVPLAFAELQELALRAAEGFTLTASRIHDAGSALVDDGAPALRTEVRRLVFGNENLLIEQEDSSKWGRDNMTEKRGKYK